MTGSDVLNRSKLFMILTAAFLALVVGCSNHLVNEGDRILVERRDTVTDVYENYCEITESDKVQQAKRLLDNINWKAVKVTMAYPSDYKFSFGGLSEDDRPNIIYHLWISPNRDKVELVVYDESKYIQLSTGKSSELFEIITGKRLTED